MLDVCVISWRGADAGGVRGLEEIECSGVMAFTRVSFSQTLFIYYILAHILSGTVFQQDELFIFVVST